VSTVAQPAVLRTIVRGGSSTGELRAPARPRLVIRLITFAALGGFGVIEWGKLVKPAPTGRLLGLLGLALVLVAVGPLMRRYRRLLVPVVAVVALLGALAVCGVPVGWITHVRIAVTADWIGQGLQALPGIFIPYTNINESVRLVILLGAAVLLLDGALLLAFAPPALGDLRRAGAALPLVALAVVPATLMRPSLPYAEGMLLFVLLAAFVWGERVRRDDLSSLVVVCAVAGAAGMFLAPRLDSHKPWLDYQALTRSIGPGYVARFNWTQQYGPVGRQWPHTGHTVVKITAGTPEYWKTEDLDLFNGERWGLANYASPDLSGFIDRTALRRWTQTIQVTLTAIDTTDVIAAGDAGYPQHLRGVPIQGSSLGTWTDAVQLHTGDSYRVGVYAPRPTRAQLAHAGRSYPPAAKLRNFLTVFVPPGGGYVPQQVVFPLFGVREQGQNFSDFANWPTGASVLAKSPYRPAYELARRLAHGAPTPYDFVERVLNYLQYTNGYYYQPNTPFHSYPLLNFLFNTKLGYCQHFAGAMALLLRMGGVPTRVAVGFTSGKLNSATRTWDVSDKDAHAWVEAWFPHYGWVTFDPTPANAPEFAHIAPNAPGPSLSAIKLQGLKGGRKGVVGPSPGSGGGPSAAPTGGSSDVVLPILGGLLLALAIAALVFTHGPAESSDEELLAELERALARSGRPVPADVTLAVLEDRFGSSSEAASYVRTLRLARFAGQRGLPTRRQRRALRRQLRSRLGIAGALRALWALPPRWSLRRLAWGGANRGIHSK
jgi:transglutaminase-like putative cysteine protease